ncbi:GL21171 [Drosophila persimilis]|uniref:GL21171 n=2 Tax=Drosophila persimilis TaxID=7234 RepID=B4HAT1_DROPE|nr:GL21171 [Drosophila persimilis]
MSFLSSMQQYVTSGISSLGLGNRRFSLSRQESSEQQSGGVGGVPPGGIAAATPQPPFAPQQQLQQQPLPLPLPLQQQQQQQQLLLQQQQQQPPHGHPPLQQQTSIGSGLGIGLGAAAVYGAPATPIAGVGATASGSNYPSGGVVIGNPNATNPLLGYPKTGAGCSSTSASGSGGTPQSRRQSRALECLAPPRTGSFRQRNSPLHQVDPPPRPPLAFCKRRLSWPEVDPRSNSG